MFKQIHKEYKKIIPPVWRKKVQIMLAILIAGVVIVIQFWGAESPPLLVHFYNVGQGDAIHIRTQDGFDVLIDGGPDASIVEKLGRNMPFWDKAIELMILTHPHADHLVGQLGVLDRFEVKRVISTGVLHTTDEYLMWLRKIEELKIPMQIVSAGVAFEITNFKSQITNKSEIQNHKLEIIYPFENFEGKRVVEKGIGEGGGLNDTSIVARLVFGQHTFLFTGDIGDEVEKELLSSQLTADVLKVAHHGSKYSSSQEFLQAVNPKYAVVQVGKKNDFGHPHFQTLWRLKQIGAEILRNDKDGDVSFVSDGIQLRKIAL